MHLARDLDRRAVGVVGRDDLGGQIALDLAHLLVKLSLHLLEPAGRRRSRTAALATRCEASATHLGPGDLEPVDHHETDLQALCPWSGCDPLDASTHELRAIGLWGGTLAPRAIHASLGAADPRRGRDSGPGT